MVSNQGVKGREDFLRASLVLRLVGRGIPIWEDFRIWVQKNWGVSYSKLQPLSDGLWLMPCSSRAEVDRVMALNRWKYKDFQILADYWIENAGRSGVIRSLGEVWVRIDGIPLHLRSDELLAQLGNFCGEVREIQDQGVSLNEVRIRIVPNEVIPDEIPLCYESFVFPVRVAVEPIGPQPAIDSGDRFLHGWKGKGRGVYVRRRRVDGVDMTSDGPLIESIRSRTQTIACEGVDAMSCPVNCRDRLFEGTDINGEGWMCSTADCLVSSAAPNGGDYLTGEELNGQDNRVSFEEGEVSKDCDSLVGQEIDQVRVGQRVGVNGLAQDFAMNKDGEGADLFGQVVALSQQNLISKTQLFFQLWWALFAWPISLFLNPCASWNFSGPLQIRESCFQQDEYNLVEYADGRNLGAASLQRSEELGMFRLSRLLSDFVDLRFEDSIESPDISREETLHEVLLRRKKAPSRSPQERALRQLGVERTDVSTLVSTSRPRRNGYAPLRLSL
ncbi:unnamed protein product [Linum tenue]|uniref:DUF4283 domain-containing protein n=2 Tax=Linum tenue TaxID=586396 RepID=A0AAV0IVD5_9ROSI|nr:unnamed protein product [Linum tenue]